MKPTFFEAAFLAVLYSLPVLAIIEVIMEVMQ